MGMTAGRSTVVLVCLVLMSACAKDAARTHPTPSATVPVLWQDPATRGVRAPSPPRPPFRFVKEDMDGASPKFTVTDAEQLEWEVKLGPEAHTEVAAGHIISAAGYFVEEMHYLPSIRVEGLDIRRGREFLTADGTVRNVRLEARRDSIRRGDTWDWAENPFVGTRELDGLRALMVIINNYDARTGNNRVLLVDADGRTEARYVVADIGASFGRYGGMGGERSRNDLEGYRTSRFIERVEDGHVYFAYRTRPEGWATALFVLNPFYTTGELKKQRDMHTMPVASARWIGRRLSALGDRAIIRAFERAGYSREEVAGFSSVVRDRIRQLASL